MKLFICWSGPKSKQIAEAMREWLPEVLDGLQTPFISSAIPKGSQWFQEVGTNLQEADAGLICLTPENLNSPWMHYEAGALAHRFASEGGPDTDSPPRGDRIFTYLCGVQSSELTGPLTAYQFTSYEEDDTKKLVKSIARLMHKDQGHYDKWEQDLERGWRSNWRKLEERITAPLEVKDLVDKFQELFVRKTYDEQLRHCTNQDWIGRFDGVQETLDALESHKRSIEQSCRPYHVDLYTELLMELDGYKMDMGALLTKRFQDAGGYLQLEPEGLAEECERHREGIKALVAQILDSANAPFVDEAWRYSKLETCEKKQALIEQKDQEMQRERLRFSRRKHRPYLDSRWELDRIVYFLILKNSPSADPGLVIEDAKKELEEVIAGRRGSVALQYATLALKAASRKDGVDEDCKAQTEELCAQIEDYLEEHERGDEGGQ